MQERADRGTELTGAQVRPPHRPRHNLSPPATMRRRTRKRPSRHPLTLSRPYRRRRTHPRPRQVADSAERATADSSRAAGSGEILVKKPFHRAAWGVEPRGRPTDYLSLAADYRYRSIDHCLWSVFGKQSIRPRQRGRTGVGRPATRGTGSHQAARVRPCRVALRLHGSVLEGNPASPPVAAVGDRSASVAHLPAQHLAARSLGCRRAPWPPRHEARTSPHSHSPNLRDWMLGGRGDRGPGANVGRLPATRRRPPFGVLGPVCRGDGIERQAQRRQDSGGHEHGPPQGGHRGNVTFCIKCDVPGLAAQIAST